jgi:hypothetical protein
LDHRYQRTIPSFHPASRPLPSPHLPNLDLCRLQIQRTIDQTYSKWISLPAPTTLIRSCREPLAVLTSIDRKGRIISIGLSGQPYARSAECAFGRREEIYQPTIIIVAPLPRISSRRHLCLLHASRSTFFESRNAHHPSIPFIPSTTSTSTHLLSSLERRKTDLAISQTRSDLDPLFPHQRKKIATYPIAYHLVTRDIPSSHSEQPTRSITPNAKGSSTFDCSYFWTGLLGEWRRVVRADAPY